MNKGQRHRWVGRVAMVTGASSGIGRAVALRLAAEGMRVVVTARRKDRLDALCTAPGEWLNVPADLRNEKDVLAVFQTVRKEWGGVSVLVNNAGLGHASSLIDGNTEAWREMLDVNVLSLCVCTREAVRDMRANGDDGHVIHVSSMAAHRVPPGSGVYSATKYAVRALTEGLRQELRAAGSGIRVGAISPGFVETEFAALYHRSEEAARETYGRFPVLQPEDVAESVWHVLSAPAHVQIHDVLMRPRDQAS